MKSLSTLMLMTLSWLSLASPALAQTKISEMSLDRWAKMREVERYQLNIAEKYFKEKKYEFALKNYTETITYLRHGLRMGPVSYTHLTLPTNREV